MLKSSSRAEEVHPVAGYQPSQAASTHIENLLQHHRGSLVAAERLPAEAARARARTGWHRLAPRPARREPHRAHAGRPRPADHAAPSTSSGSCSAHAGLPAVQRLPCRGRERAASWSTSAPARNAAQRRTPPSPRSPRTGATERWTIERLGLRLELEQIQARYEEGDLLPLVRASASARTSTSCRSTSRTTCDGRRRGNAADAEQQRRLMKGELASSFISRPRTHAPEEPSGACGSPRGRPCLQGRPPLQARARPAGRKSMQIPEVDRVRRGSLPCEHALGSAHMKKAPPAHQRGPPAGQPFECAGSRVYIFAGAVTPKRSRVVASTMRVASTSARRASRSAASSPMTWQFV